MILASSLDEWPTVCLIRYDEVFLGSLSKGVVYKEGYAIQQAGAESCKVICRGPLFELELEDEQIHDDDDDVIDDR